MNKEECMDILEQIILELPQYRKITNEMCNRYISDYVRKEYEQEPIYTEGEYSSSRDYCWDIYDTVPIGIIESILDNFKEQDDIKEENTNLKQALNEIRGYCKEINNLFWVVDDEPKYVSEDILEIIDKVFRR